jgi:hypothetical protein
MRAFIMRALIPSARFLPPRPLRASGRTWLSIAAARIFVPCFSFLAPFLTALFPPLLTAVLPLRPRLRRNTALLQIGRAAMPAISSLKPAHPAECPAILVAWIAAAIPAFTASPAIFTATFAGAAFRGRAGAVSRPVAADIDIHRSIIVMNIDISVPPVEPPPKIWNRGTRVIPAAALAGFHHKRFWDRDCRGTGREWPSLGLAAKRAREHAD